MNILLTHAYFLEEDIREQAIMKPYPPLGILSISAYLKVNGLACEVFDSTFSSFDQLCQRLLSAPPALLGIYVNLMTKPKVVRLLAFIRSQPSLSQTTVALGGPEVTHHAEQFLLAGADVLVVGEGEQTFLELARTCLNKSQPNDWSDIQGLIFRDEDHILQHTTERAKIKDLDTLPVPDREAIDLHAYFQVWKQKHGESAISVSTMRGCPYSCKWCSRAVYGLSYRRRSPEKVVEELIQLQQRYDFDSIWFVDDVFTVSHQWLRKFASLVTQNNLRIRYECITRADRMNEEVVGLLRQSGCFRVWIGAESGSQRILDAMDRRVEVAQVQQMIQLAKAHGIQTGTFLMLGYPGETEADIEATILHLKRAQPDLYTVTMTYPIKGTELYQEVEASLEVPTDWATTTDRDLRYPRTYSDRYYQYALSRIRHEVEFSKLQADFPKKAARIFKAKARSQAAKFMMNLEKNNGTSSDYFFDARLSARRDSHQLLALGAVIGQILARLGIRSPDPRHYFPIPFLGR